MALPRTRRTENGPLHALGNNRRRIGAAPRDHRDPIRRAVATAPGLGEHDPVKDDQPAVCVTGLVKRYRHVQALKAVDVSVAAATVVALLGPNGAGKSTLTKVLCGLVRPDAGAARVAGKRAGSRAARARTGYLAELFRFPGWLTA